MAADATGPGRIDGLMHERWFDAEGRWVHTADWEPAEPRAGAVPVVLVHGLGASTLSWELVGAGLADRLGTRVTALDLPGFGRSRARRPATMSSHRAAVTALLRDRGPAVVMGNSMGGATSVGVAARHPELVRGLVLVNAAFPRPGANLDQLARTARYAALTLPAIAAPIVRARAQRLGPERLVDTTLGLVFADGDRIDPDLRTRLVALANERRAYPEAARAYTESGGSLFRYVTAGMRSDLDTIRGAHPGPARAPGPVGAGVVRARRRRTAARVAVRGAGRLRARPAAGAAGPLRRHRQPLGRPRASRSNSARLSATPCGPPP